MTKINQPTVPLVILSLIAGSALPTLAQQSAEPTFPSANAASQALLEAVQSNDEQAITKILGGPTELTTSRDPGRDRADRQLFAQKYQQMHRLAREADGSVTLYIGAENWPFPVPLVNQNGAWRFSPEAGEKEVLFRRIGEDELSAIVNCEKFANAEERYAEDPGDPDNVLPASLAAKAARGSATGDPVLLSGYYFRLLPIQSAKGHKPGGIALIAYPQDYRSSGVMTFVVPKDGVVYEKDLGPNTTAIASTMPAFHNDPTWRPAGE